MVVSAPTPITAAAKPNVAIGAADITAAFFLVAVMSALGKSAVAVPTSMLVFFQTGISLMIFAPWAMQNGWSGLKTHRLPLHIVRAVGGLLSQALMFIAIKKMPLMNAVLLTNSAPLFIPLIALIWLREKISVGTLISLAVGFVGIMLILRPGRSLLTNPSAAIAVLSAVCSAIGLVAINRLSLTDSTQAVLVYYFLISSMITAPLMIFSWHMPDVADALRLVGVGFCLSGSQLLIILAYRHAKPERIAPFNYSVVVFSGLIGWIVWHATPTWLSLAGVLLVCLGGMLSTILASPNSRGHLLWPGHWNLPFLHARHQGHP